MQQVAEKKQMQLLQYGAQTSETAAYQPELDKDFSKPRREATVVMDAQVIIIIIIIIMNISSAPNLTYKALSAHKQKKNQANKTSQRPPHSKQSCNPHITFQKLY